VQVGVNIVTHTNKLVCCKVCNKFFTTWSKWKKYGQKGDHLVTWIKLCQGQDIESSYNGYMYRLCVRLN